MAEKILFIVFAALAVIGALGVITRSNVVHGLILLVFTFLNVAGIFLLTQAYFLAVIQVLVYAGAILVLFAFVVMFLNLREFQQLEQLHPQAEVGGAGARPAHVGRVHLRGDGRHVRVGGRRPVT